MDTLSQTIVASCPGAFSGTSGALFVNALTAVIAAHCGIVDKTEWPLDNSKEILQQVHGELDYDFIIVGAGTAGSIVASGLSKRFPSRNILLIEAGEDPGLDSEIPAFLFLNQNEDIDWSYKPTSDGKSCLGFENNTCTWNKGRTMGGSGSINAMLYIRGHPMDYDTWSTNRVTEWDYEHLKPYFDRVEKHIQQEDCESQVNPLDAIIRSAWDQLGFISDDSDNIVRIGTKKTKLLTRHGKRLNTAKVYLKEINNLYVMKNTVVKRIIIDAQANIAHGVEIIHASGITANVSVKKEVILSAGSIATPQILMLSGIGPVTYLDAIGIKCLANLPVGQNLQDHVILPIFFKTGMHTHLPSHELLSFFVQYMLTKTGPLSNIGVTDFMGFISTDNSSEYPDIQFHHTYFAKNDKLMFEKYLNAVGYRQDIIEQIIESNTECDVLGIYPTLIHPKSRGEIFLVDTYSKPIIKPNYFEHPDDINKLIKAIRFLQIMTDTDSFKSVGVELNTLSIPGCSKYVLASVDYWECYIRHMATTIYHPVGTAKISSRSDEGVVNENLLVHGFRNLRVVDASIMPTIPSSNTMAPTMAIAEKAVDIVHKYYAERVEL